LTEFWIIMERWEPNDMDDRILVIHNNDEIVSHNTINLVSMGYKVHSVDEESMGLKLLAADPTGWSLVILKQRPNSITHTQNVINAVLEISPHLPVVLVSNQSQRLAKDLFTGIATIIEWPYDARQLAMTIQTVLRGQKRRAV